MLRPDEPVTSTPTKRETVAFIIPLYNELEVLPLLLDQLERYRTEHPCVRRIIFIDDGSKDGTPELLRTLASGWPGYVLIRFSRNFGHQLAITAGMELVEEDAAVILDADLQDPLDTVTRMIEKWREGYDVVYGVRVSREGETRFKLATASLFYRLFRWMTDLEMPLDAGDFRLVSRRVLEAYRLIGEQQPFVRGLISWLGFNQVGIEYERAQRAAGTTKYSLKKMFGLAANSITSFSDKPLKLAALIGIYSTLIALVGLVWVLLVKYVFHSAITGWSSLIFVIFFFGGLQVFFLGVVGLYLDRVYQEVKGRPRYIVQERWSSSKPDGTDPDLVEKTSGRNQHES